MNNDAYNDLSDEVISLFSPISLSEFGEFTEKFQKDFNNVISHLDYCS